jgi:hypothetical protein
MEGASTHTERERRAFFQDTKKQNERQAIRWGKIKVKQKKCFP